jgi:phage gp29-like protein
MQDKRKFSDEIATRSRAGFAYLGMYLPNPDQVLKSLGRDITVYREIQTNPYVRGAIKNRLAGTLSLNWSIDRGKTKSRQAKIVEDLFADLDMQGIISSILDATQFGYQPLEIIWEQGKWWLPKAIIAKPPEWFLFGNTNELRFKSIAAPYAGEELPPNQFLLARQEATYNNPYGYADLSSCFWPVTFMKGDLTFWVRFLEKFGMPKIVGKHPRGTDPAEVTKQIADLDSIVQDGICSIPDDSSVELLEETGRAGTSAVYKDLIAECKNEISVVQLGHEGGFQSTPGKLGETGTSEAVRKDIVNADKKIVEAVFNEQLIPLIWELNFAGQAARPTFSMWEEEDIDESLSRRDAELSRTGVRFNPVYFQRNYGLQEDEFTIAEPTVAPAPEGPVAAFAEGADARNRGLDQVDGIVERVNEGADLSEWWSSVDKLLAQVTTMEELRDKLIDLYPEMKPEKLGNLLSQAFVEAELAGRFELLKDIGITK